MKKFSLLFAGVSSLGLAAIAPAAAQTASEPPTTAVAAEDEMIVVTARRREEALQDVPISVTAISGQELAERNVTNIQQLTNAVPGITATPGANSRDSLAFAIRGQRSGETALLTDPPVGFYFAEVVQPRPFGFGFALYDLQNVQVLKGVQGTLFGRNMTGGAILIEPTRPRYETAGELRVEAGNYNMRSTYGMFNLPVVDDVLAVRGNFLIRERDGFTIDNRTGRDYDNQDYQSGRLSILFDPSDNIRNLTIFDGVWAEDNGTGNVLTNLRQVADPNVNPNGLPSVGDPARLGAAGVSALAAAFAQQQQLGPRRVVGSVYDGNFTGLGVKQPFPGDVPFNNIQNWGITDQLTVDFNPDLRLKTIVGYRRAYFRRNIDFFNVPVNVISTQTADLVRTYSAEVQLQGRSFDRLDWVTGVFGLREQGLGEWGLSNQLSEGLADPSSTTTERRVEGEALSAAVFVAGTYELAEQWKVSGGVRWNYDERSVESSNRRRSTGACLHTDFPNGSGVCLLSNEEVWHALTWDATLQWEPTDTTTIYGSVRSGFRSGGFNARSATRMTQVQPFDPEEVMEYELGAKQRWDFEGGDLTANVAVYDQDMTNAQVVRSLLVGTPPILTQVTTNAGAQHNYGLDLDVSLGLDSGFDLTFFYAFNNVAMTENRLPVRSPFGSPKHQAGLSLGYDFPVAETLGDLSGGIDISYRSNTHLDDISTAADQPPYSLVNLHLNWDRVMNSNVGLGLFVNNALDETYRQITRANDDVASNIGVTGTIYGEPRMYGMSARYTF